MSPAEDKFQTIKRIVIQYMRDNNQFENQQKFERDIKYATSFIDIRKAVDDYWGWEDEQTVWLLETIIEKL